MLTHVIYKHDNIVEIPPEIYKRMLHKTNNLTGVFLSEGGTQYSRTPVGIKKSLSDEKYYLFSSYDVGSNSISSCLIGFYILKDI